MSLKVLYTDEAKETLIWIQDFICGKFGQRSADDFVMKAEKTISLIADQPFMFKASPVDFNVRIGFITKQCSIYYRVTEAEIHLLVFWVNRQEPVLF